MNKYEIAKERYLQGESVKTIAKDLHISAVQFSNYLKREGVQLRGKSSTTKDWSSYLPRVVALRNQGVSIRKIHETLKIPRAHISHLLKENNEVTTDPRLHKYHEGVFDVIDTEEKAYWLGLLYADGYVGGTQNMVQLTLQNKDIEHLKSFADFIGRNIPIYSHSKDTDASRVVITNKRLNQALIKQGCVSKKSLILTFPTQEQVPNHLVHHFIRGYFDGDGGLYLETNPKYGTQALLFHVTGTEMFLKEIENIYETNNQLQRERKLGNVFTLRVKGNQKPLVILDHLYQNATIYLDRKYRIYRLFKTQSMPSEGESRQIISAELSGEVIEG